MFSSKLFVCAISLLSLAIFEFPLPRLASHVLEIPSLGITADVVEGYSMSILSKGNRVLLDPVSRKGNNLVVYGHSFTHNNPLDSAFAKLEHVMKGDSVYLTLESGRRQYVVESILVVTPEDLWVTHGSQESLLTLITCTPIFNPIKRLVVVAKLVSIE
ncbi:sortase [bacterium]|nr:sortase [bacterium]